MILTMRNPGVSFRCMIAGAQWISWLGYFTMYGISPSICHRTVGFLEEEAVHTYTVMVEQMDKEGTEMQEWGRQPAPQEAIEYYDMDEEATVYDMIMNIRADEACHRDLNHHFADIPSHDAVDFHSINI